MAELDDTSREAEERRAAAARLLGTGLTEQQVAEMVGVDADQVRRWDDDAAIDGEHNQLADVLGVSSD